MCDSVRPEIMRKPRAASAVAIACAFLMTCAWYVLNSGCDASKNAVALPAITCIKGPPCKAGNTLEFSDFSNSALAKIIPPRGPRNVLCVVEVTKSACGTGFG